MKFQRVRAALILAMLALVATACGGSDSTQSDGPATTSAAAAEDTETAESVGDSDADPAETDDDDPEDPAADDSAADDTDQADAGGTESGDADNGGETTDSSGTDGAAENGEAAADIPEPGEYDIEANVLGFVRALFNVEPTPEAIECLVEEANQRPILERAFAKNAPVFAEFGDETLYEVTTSMNGCVDAVALGGWATEAVGPSADVSKTAPPCFAESFADEATGDDLFHTFVALSFQYRYDPEYVPAMTEILATCTPVTALSAFFANQAEAESNYETEIDRDCFIAAVDNKEASLEFWGTLIDGQVPPFSVMAPYLAECASVVGEGLVQDLPADFVAWSGNGGLADVLPEARANAYSAPPPMSIDPAGTYTAILATGGGEIEIALFADSAPVTVNNFVSLARDGFYDGTVFHRVLDEFMAQAGDPTGTGTGGPGYQFEDETAGGPPLDKPGLLAMANSGPNTNGSQFFITFVPTDWLTGNHTVFGQVISGQDIVDAIERRDPSFPEGRGQILESVTIIEG